MTNKTLTLIEQADKEFDERYFARIGMSDMSNIKSHISSLLLSIAKGECERLAERIKYIDDYRSGKNDQDFRNGWSGSESGDCCDKCKMTIPVGNIAKLIGCKNPFQMEDICECHVPFRKVAAKVERNALSHSLEHWEEIISYLEKKL